MIPRAARALRRRMNALSSRPPRSTSVTRSVPERLGGDQHRLDPPRGPAGHRSPCPEQLPHLGQEVPGAPGAHVDEPPQDVVPGDADLTGADDQHPRGDLALLEHHLAVLERPALADPLQPGDLRLGEREEDLVPAGLEIRQLGEVGEAVVGVGHGAGHLEGPDQATTWRQLNPGRGWTRGSMALTTGALVATCAGSAGAATPASPRSETAGTGPTPVETAAGDDRTASPAETRERWPWDARVGHAESQLFRWGGPPLESLSLLPLWRGAARRTRASSWDGQSEGGETTWRRARRKS